jgi:hypothetical protein
MSTYELTDDGLAIPDMNAFGLESGELYEQPDFRVALDAYDRPRRSYSIHKLVLEHIESGRFFATEYSMHEMEGFEWGPGMGRDDPPKWTEQVRKEVTTFVFEAKS